MCCLLGLFINLASLETVNETSGLLIMLAYSAKLTACLY
jgi:hypothetical protein